ncbi:hypothetical protein DACRYDRAFT_84258 [Dacryopinax primogenitus]|uniref:N-alpha-acetyltransferase 40 n=1 Tax=Dacryopinax primogenitus (strain DJM 731) TaxID=1858805 RepID=M5G2C7_DACPD|nr:uncharacterized protein DACRYDRAFT_84258 [Dacryopinax primogenitus]EJT97922.1 hypothetical protein DACRYDRAFT_84258 [Dacryopinax primogenitus]
MPSKSKKSNRVDIACRASANDLSTLLPLTYTPPSLPTTTYTVSILSAEFIPPSLRTVIWILYEHNMRTLSEGSSMGWDPRAKARELWHRDSRFVLLRELRRGDGKGKGREMGRDETSLAAFSMFRFDWEQCMDDDWKGDECEVLYCYELQVASPARRLGVGKFLVDQLILLAREYKMRKVMLTCLKANTHALAFYASQAFTIDPISPSQLPKREMSDAGITTLPGGTQWGDGRTETGVESEDQGTVDGHGDGEWEEEEEEGQCDYEILSRRVA